MNAKPVLITPQTMKRVNSLVCEQSRCSAPGARNLFCLILADFIQISALRLSSEPPDCIDCAGRIRGIEMRPNWQTERCLCQLLCDRKIPAFESRICVRLRKMWRDRVVNKRTNTGLV